MLPVAVVVAMLSTVLVGCSSSARRQTPPPDPRAVALAVADLPFGWATSPPSTDSSVTAPCSAITAEAVSRLPQRAEADFQQSEDGPFLQEIVAAGPRQQVSAVWTSIQKAPGLCASSTRLSPTSFPSYGDQSFAWRLAAVRSGVSYGGDVVAVRTEQAFVEVVVFGLGGVSEPLVREMVGKALGKFGS